MPSSPEKRRVQARARRRANPQKVRDAERSWRVKNRDRVREYNRRQKARRAALALEAKGKH